jgi:hypothetical protein
MLCCADDKAWQARAGVVLERVAAANGGKRLVIPVGHRAAVSEPLKERWQE